MQQVIRSLWVLILLSLVPALLWAATFHVTTTGLDSNPCTQAAPCRTIARGIAVTASGDTLTIHAGVYDENHLRPKSGTTIQGAPGDTVIMRPTSGPNAPGLETTSSQSNIVIRNLHFDGSREIFSYGMLLRSTTTLIEDVEVAFPRNQGIALYCDSNATGCASGKHTLRRVHSHHAGQGSTGCHGTTSANGFCHGVYVYSSDNVIEGGEFDHANGWGIQTYGLNLTVSGALVHENFAGGLTVPGSVTTYNSIFWGNDPTGNNATVWSGSNSQYYSLTIADNAGIGLFLPGNAGNNIVKNIISVNNRPNVRNDPGVSIQNSITSGAVNFVNAGAHDYHLASSASNAINQGATLGAPYNVDKDGVSRPQGSAYDIGAYEFTSGGGDTTPPPGGGALVGSFATPASLVVLSSEGTTDWAHWGLTTPSSFDHKAGGTPQISNITKIGSNSINRLADNPTAFSWSGGTPTASATSTSTGIWIQSLNNGFQITAPADMVSRTLRVYLGLWKAQGQVQASLSNGSAPTYTDTSFTNTAGTSNRVYTFNYTASASGQTLTVRYTVLNSFDPFGNVTLAAATLASP
jgi:hypothetical protein